MFKKTISIITVISIILSMFVTFGTFAASSSLIELTFEKEGEKWSAWSATGAELNVFSKDAYSEGSQSLYLNDDSSELTAGIKTDRVNVTAGKTYTALCDIYLVSGNISVNLRFYDVSGNQLSSDSLKGTKGQWVNLAITKEAPAGAVTSDIVIASVKASKSYAYIDNIKLTEGEVKAGTVTGKAPSATSGSTSSSTSESSSSSTSESTSVSPKDDGVADGTLLYSSSFESGLGDWAYFNESSKDYVKEVNGKASDGSNSITVNDNSDSAGPGVVSPKITVSEGNTYTILIDTIGVSGTIKLFVKYYNTSGKVLVQTSMSIPSSTDWQTVAYQTSAPADSVKAEIAVCGIKVSIGEVYVDNVRFYKGIKRVEVTETEYIPPKQVSSVDANIVAPVGNKLVYNTYNEQGDTLGDYSYGGFYEGAYELPETKNLPVEMELSPTGTSDDTAMIQKAIDDVYSNASDDNFKVIKLKAGKYYINKTGIRLKSGIILSGEGQGPTGTILYAYEEVKNTPVMISGTAPKSISGNYNITDDYVKSGSNKINLSESDILNFKVGDLITVYHPSTEKWVEGMRMVNMESSAKGDNSWRAGAVDMATERTITAINGTEITLDFALFVPLNKEYAQSYIYKIDDTQRIKHVGIENLRIESYYNGKSDDENHGNNAISFSYAKDCFVRDVSVKHFILSAVACGIGTKRVTVLNCSSLEPISIVQGGRRYAFANSTSAQQTLFAGNYSYDGRHDFEASFTVTGPIVFVDNIIDKSNSSAETHGTWSTGVLYDNIYQVPNDTPGYLCLANRGIYGTSKSQGWTAGGSVMWNTLSNLVIVHKPPLTYQNFSVGTWGNYTDDSAKTLKSSKSQVYRKYFRSTDYYNAQDSHYATNDGTSFIGDAYKEAEYTPVNPRSLYKAQLSERITGVISNARPNAPVVIYPRADKETDNKNVTVSGIYQLGATEVSVYIDDVKYKASMNSADNSFEISMDLAEGVHKIYATQVIDGYESTKTADRFITIGKANGNPSYLQSIYSSEKTRMIVNDTRETFDVVQDKLAQQEADKIIVLVNDSILVSDVEPFETNGRVLVPMRAIFEALKAEVSWDEATVTATATLNGTEVKITENQTTAYVNSNPITLDVPATIVNGRFVVPVRFISESFGATVGWNDARRTVTVDGGVKYPTMHGLAKELDIHNAIQSGDDGAGSTIQNVFDNDFDTKWGVAYDENKPDGAYGIFDFGNSIDIDSMYISFNYGEKRVYTLDIYVSDDNVTYTPVKIDFKSSGTTSEFEQISLNVKGRYIKVVGKANSVNQWLNVREIAFTGK